LRGALAGPAQDHAGGHHARAVRALRGALHGTAAQARLPLGGAVPHRRRLFHVPSMTHPRSLRGLADPIGFAHSARQIQAVLQRPAAQDDGRLGRALSERGVSDGDRWRLAIAPHDDYAYAGRMYPLALKNLRAPTVVIFGVAHKARELGLADRLVFDSF